METLSIIFVLLLTTRGVGAIAARFNQPVLVGELIAGLGLGVLISIYGQDVPILKLSENHHFMTMTDLGIFFLMLMGGLEMRPRELIESGFNSLIISISAMALPLVSGFVLAWVWLPETPLQFAQSLFVGTALAITAVPVTIKVLIDMDLLRTRMGKLIVSAAVMDDLLSLVLLSVLTAILNTGGVPSGAEISIIVVRVLVFLSAVFVLGKYVLPTVARRLSHTGVDEMEFSFLILSGAVFAFLAEALGLHFIMGAFAAGLFFNRQTINSEVYSDLRNKVSAITTGLFAPIFFASIGLELNLSAVTEIPLFLAMLIFVAFAGKLFGAAIPAIMTGIAPREAWGIGAAMSGRGAVELIIAGIALQAGLFEQGSVSSPVVENLFSAIVIVAVITTLMAPIGLRYILKR